MTKKPPKKRYGLSRYHNRKTVRDFVDFDYTKKLDPAELDFLDKFSREYYDASFRKNNSDLHAEVEQKRDCYRKNNERNRDLWHKFERLPNDYCDTTSFEDDEITNFHRGVEDTE